MSPQMIKYSNFRSPERKAHRWFFFWGGGLPIEEQKGKNYGTIKKKPW